MLSLVSGLLSPASGHWLLAPGSDQTANGLSAAPWL